MSRADWIAVDWGTSAVRAWAIAADGGVLAEARGDRGMATLVRKDYESVLLGLAESWLERPLPAVVCGMAGSRQGWIEAPYSRVPCDPRAVTAVQPAVADPRLSVTVLGGVKQEAPADVMRGEETQIAGVLTGRPDFDGILCLPGTHTKWAQVSAGEIVSFRSFMTGELFDLLSHRSVLRHTVGEGWDDGAFAEAVADALSRPEAIAQRLFGIRAEGLLHGLAAPVARARLSGLLVGAELAAARPYWLGQAVLVVGSAASAGPYAAALGAQGVAPEVADGDAMTLAGLAHARARLEEPA